MSTVPEETFPFVICRDSYSYLSLSNRQKEGTMVLSPYQRN
jgi:hypothetical protein